MGRSAAFGSWCFNSDRLIAVARVWCVIAALLFTFHVARQLQVDWTDGAGAPLGEDFLNFWSAAHLSATGNWPLIYDLQGFHRFENAVVGGVIGLYHYSYPPVTWLLTAPLAALPYPVALAFWQVGGWALFAAAIRRIAPHHWLLLSLATPAVFINATGGQNGCWLAAAIGWGLILLSSRPILAGAIFAVFVIKPQLGWLIPIALLAGGERRALLGFIVTAVALLLLSVAVYGPAAWLAYAERAQMLTRVILEHGSGTWHRMLSVFVFVRHAGSTAAIAYGAQAIASCIAAALVARIWRRHGPEPTSAAVLVLGLLASAIYVSDYDCVMVALAAAWHWPRASQSARFALAAAILLPLFAAVAANATHLALGMIVLWIAFLAVVHDAMQPDAELDARSRDLDLDPAAA
ncbi:MAG: glycosyltransferase family 87 protein [Sphingomicrobium sp.]